MAKDTKIAKYNGGKNAMPKRNNMDRFLKYLDHPENFARQDMLVAMNKSGTTYTKKYMDRVMYKLLKEKKIVRTGMNQYCLPEYAPDDSSPIFLTNLDKYRYVLKFLEDDTSFSRADFLKAAEKAGICKDVAWSNNGVTMLNKNKEIVRLEQNRYCVMSKANTPYEYEYGQVAERIAGMIKEHMPETSFSIMELYQLNEFVGNELSTNVIMVYTDAKGRDGVFRLIRDVFPGKVLLNPDRSDIHVYWTEDLIAVKRLITESPAGAREAWHACLEKLLVDLCADKTIREILPEAEIPIIYEKATKKYNVDRTKMLRYAGRRNAERMINMLEKGTWFQTV